MTAIAFDSHDFNLDHNYDVIIVHNFVSQCCVWIVRLLDIICLKNDNAVMDTSIFNEKIGEKIRDLRKAKGFTQEDFAALTGFSRGTIANMETGRQTASGHQLYHLATVLGVVSMDEIFPRLPLDDDDEDGELRIHRSPELSDAQLAQIQAVARSVR